MKESEKIKEELKKVQKEFDRIGSWINKALDTVDELTEIEETVKQKAEERKDAKD